MESKGSINNKVIIRFDGKEGLKGPQSPHLDKVIWNKAMITLKRLRITMN